MHRYKITMKHDSGKFSLKVTSTNIANAIKLALDAENAPELSILKIERLLK